MRRRDELAERAHQRERELDELRGNTERRQNELGMELREIHEQMRRIEEELARIERERQEHRRRLLDEVRGQTEELREHLRGAPPVLELDFDQPRPPSQIPTPRGSVLFSSLTLLVCSSFAGMTALNPTTLAALRRAAVAISATGRSGPR